jgi:hypothetical protein
MDDEEDFARMAKVLSEVCFRNSKLEDLHSGVSPASAEGDYSDVRVVTPYGEIPWNEVSRLNDDEMKALMMDVVDRVFTFLQHSDLLNYAPSSRRWREPRLNQELMRTVRAKQLPSTSIH